MRFTINKHPGQVVSIRNGWGFFGQVTEQNGDILAAFFFAVFLPISVSVEMTVQCDEIAALDAVHYFNCQQRLG